jgi:transposase
MIAEIAATLKQQGLLYVGDCKMSSLENRSYIEESGNY